MYICHYVESYRSPTGERVSLFHRGNYLYELAHCARHLRFFENSTLEQVRAALIAEGHTAEPQEAA